MIYIFFFFTTMLSIQETDNLLIWQIHSFEVFRNMKPKPLIIVLIQISTNKSIDPRAGISSQLTNMVTFRVRCFMFLFAFKRNLNRALHQHPLGISFRHVHNKTTMGCDDKSSVSYRSLRLSLEELVWRSWPAGWSRYMAEIHPSSCPQRGIKGCHCRICTGHIWKSWLRQRQERNDKAKVTSREIKREGFWSRTQRASVKRDRIKWRWSCPSEHL